MLFYLQRNLTKLSIKHETCLKIKKTKRIRTKKKKKKKNVGMLYQVKYFFFTVP